MVTTSVYSVTAPLPGRVLAIAEDLRPALHGVDRVREDHTLLVKRIEAEGDSGAIGRDVHQALRGAPAVEARLAGIDAFDDPPLGPAPVVYLAVESPGLERIHHQLAERFPAVAGLEGDDYVPHVTLARGGSAEVLDRLRTADVPEVTWTISELAFTDGTYRLPISRIGLPA